MSIAGQTFESKVPVATLKTVCLSTFELFIASCLLHFIRNDLGKSVEVRILYQTVMNTLVSNVNLPYGWDINNVANVVYNYNDHEEKENYGEEEICVNA